MSHSSAPGRAAWIAALTCIMDWKDADAAVAVVDAVLREWGIGHHFGISVRGIDCNSVPI